MSRSKKKARQFTFAWPMEPNYLKVQLFDLVSSLFDKVKQKENIDIHL